MLFFRLPPSLVLCSLCGACVQCVCVFVYTVHILLFISLFFLLFLVHLSLYAFFFFIFFPSYCCCFYFSFYICRRRAKKCFSLFFALFASAPFTIFIHFCLEIYVRKIHNPVTDSLCRASVVLWWKNAMRAWIPFHNSTTLWHKHTHKDIHPNDSINRNRKAKYCTNIFRALFIFIM